MQQQTPKCFQNNRGETDAIFSHGMSSGCNRKQEFYPDEIFQWLHNSSLMKLTDEGKAEIGFDSQVCLNFQNKTFHGYG